MRRTFYLAKPVCIATTILLSACAGSPMALRMSSQGELSKASEGELCHAYRFDGFWKGVDQEHIRHEVRRRLLDCPPPTYQEALAAAQKGDLGSMNEVGWYHFTGKDVERDHAEACRWFRRAADGGHLHATTGLAMCYEQGVGGLNGMEEAVRLYTVAAEGGIALAQNQLGELHFTGKGVRRDLKEAIKWYSMAVNSGQGPGAEAIRKKATLNHEGATRTMIAEHQKETQAMVSEMTETGGGKYECARVDGMRMALTSVEYCRSIGGVVVPIGGPVTATVPKSDASASKSADVVDRYRADRLAAYEEERKRRLAEYKARRDGGGSQPTVSAAPANKVAAPPSGDLVIRHPEKIEVTGPVVELSGQVIGTGAILEFVVDGKRVPIEADGRFRFKRAVPVGQSQISLSAIDEWGRDAALTISVDRRVAIAREADLPSPNPFSIRGARRPQALALIIGVERYGSVPPAQFAERDAKVFYDYASTVLGVPEGRIRLLTGDSARRLDVEKTVATWLVPQIGPQTEVFVFFSGHGLASDDGKDLFLLPFDGDRSFLSGSSIRRQDLVASITAAKPKSFRMFLDTCYSGGTRTGDTLIASIRPVLLAAKETSVPQGVAIHSASANDQVSSTLPAAKHGLFSYYLMRGLQGEADGDGDHRITDEELHEFLGRHVPSSAAMQGRTQTPQLTGGTSDPLVIW